jgi:hypothetical protein
MKIPCLNFIVLKIPPTTLVVKMLKFGVIIDHKSAIKIAIILKTFFDKFFIRSYNISENVPNYPKCIKLSARSLFKINKIEFSSKFLLFGFAHMKNRYKILILFDFLLFFNLLLFISQPFVGQF